jgi:hypothetical protein
MSELRDKIESSSARVRVFIFDACRSSPLLTAKDSAKDYAPVAGRPEGTIIAFASAHLQPAGFTPGRRNSDYTQELLAALRQPRLPDLEALLMDVRGRVFERTNRTQTPYLYGFLSGPLYLAGAPAVLPPPPAGNEVTSLLIRVDADANVTVDDQPAVSVKAGQMRRFNVAPGTHFLQVSGGGATVQKTVEVRHGEQQAMAIEVAEAIVDQKLTALLGVWTWNGGWDNTFTTKERGRFHATTTRRFELLRTLNRHELTGTYHEETNYKGLDDTKINATQYFDGTFKLVFDGHALKGSSSSAKVKWKTGEDTPVAVSVPFEGEVLDAGRINFKIVWEKDITWSGGTLTKQN